MSAEPTDHRSACATISAHPATAVVAFLVVHAAIVLAVSVAPNDPIGDVDGLYRQWVHQGLNGSWIGISGPWVYPILALVPMVAAAAAGVQHIDQGWLVVVALADAASAVILWRTANGRRAFWWWMLFLLCLGPIGVGRIDAVADALAIAGVAFGVRRPALASALFTVGAWIKVWPAALIAALALRGRTAVRALIAAVLVSAGVVATDLSLGGGRYLASFVGAQTSRGLQVESVLATPFTWAVAAGRPGYSIFFDHGIVAFEVVGHGTGFAARCSTPLMVGLVVLIAAVTGVAIARRAPVLELIPVVALAVVMTLIVANKVGSPQYVGWIAAPIAWGLIAGRRGAFLVPAALAVAIAGLTQVIYPWFYASVTHAHPLLLTVLSIRNGLEALLLLWALVSLVVLAARPTHRDRARSSAAVVAR
ncbi:glycosyltransferase 87 family protein [Curtobacterium ammoniigenes]|uniref:glycosyltransferase 87 family protein n=1 Tax=Curtobacterium ammoniigenes TaxID=395387 RepID=UPI00082AADB9|nr:glycosyltransferase 87 family protein [Curtobacterium ammoniigenes]